MPKRLCLAQKRGCQLYAVPGGSRCEACGGYASNWGRYKARYPERSALYQGEGWRRLRDRVLREEPTCRRCGTASSTDVDHIVALADGGDFWDRENLAGLCKSCHRKKTAEDNRARRKGRPRSSSTPPDDDPPPPKPVLG